MHLVVINDPYEAALCLNTDLSLISDWASKWQVDFNPKKTVSIQFTRKHIQNIKPVLSMDNTNIDEVVSHKHLGIILQNDCLWQSQIDSIIAKVSPMVNCLRSFKYRLSRKTLQTM